MANLGAMRRLTRDQWIFWGFAIGTILIGLVLEVWLHDVDLQFG
jgi:hypothetical protein